MSSSTAPDIKRELKVPPVAPPPLDPDIFAPSDDEWIFLRSVVSQSDEEIKRIALEIQKESYIEYPYPCIRKFAFMKLRMVTHPQYQHVIDQGQANPSALFLDLGCCMGTDIRKLAMDGYPASRILGCDLRREYVNLGHKLYSDSETCAIHFFTDNILDLASTAIESPGDVDVSKVQSLEDLRGQLTYIYTGSLFHLFDEETQVALAERLTLLLKRDNKGEVMIFGRHRGSEREGKLDDVMKRSRYIHSPSSWEKLWQKAFENTRGGDFAQQNVHVVSELQPNDERHKDSLIVWSVHVHS